MQRCSPFVNWEKRKKMGGGNGKGRREKIDVESSPFPPPPLVAFYFSLFLLRPKCLCADLLRNFLVTDVSLSVHPGPAMLCLKEKRRKKKKKNHVYLCNFITYVKDLKSNFQEISIPFFFFGN